MMTTFKNRCVFKIYVIVKRPIFDKTYKEKNSSNYICDIYIMNWSYYNKLGIVFAMHQRIIPKGKYWAGPRHYSPLYVNIIIQNLCS